MRKHTDPFDTMLICVAVSFFCAGAAVVNLIYAILYFLGVL